MAVFARRVALAVGVAPIAMVCVVTACGLDTSGTDVGGDDASGLASDGAPLDAGHVDAFALDALGSPDSLASGDAREASVEPDAGDAGDAADAADSCPSTTEICNNGVDDNCDGKIDCADPQCAAWTCVGGPIPSGWTLAEVSPASPSTCSTGYGSPAPFYGGTFPAAECTCAASVSTPGTCKGGTITIAGNGTSNQAGCNAFSVMFPANGGACVGFTPFTPIAGENLQVTPAPYTPGMCTATPTTTLPPIAAAGQACALSVATGAGCPNMGGDGTCVPDVSNGADACIVHGGNVGCPPGIGFDHQQIVGSGTTDTRGCSTCSATGPTATCTDAELTLFSSASCAGDAGPSLPATGACNAIPGGGPSSPTYAAQEYSATVHGETCAASTVTPTGGVAVTGTMTYCCR